MQFITRQIQYYSQSCSDSRIIHVKVVYLVYDTWAGVDSVVGKYVHKLSITYKIGVCESHSFITKMWKRMRQNSTKKKKNMSKTRPTFVSCITLAFEKIPIHTIVSFDKRIEQKCPSRRITPFIMGQYRQNRRTEVQTNYYFVFFFSPNAETQSTIQFTYV